MTLNDLPIFDGTQHNCIVFRPNLYIASEFSAMDPSTFFEYFATPIFDNTDKWTIDYLLKEGQLHYQQLSSRTETLWAYYCYTTDYHPIHGVFPVLDINYEEPQTYEEKRALTAVKEDIGKRLSSFYYNKVLFTTEVTDKELQVKGVDRIAFDGTKIDDKFIFGNYNGTYQIEVSNPQFSHSEGTYEGDKLTDEVWVWNFVEKYIRVIDWKKMSKALKEDEGLKFLVNDRLRETRGTGKNGTLVADIKWYYLAQRGLYRDIYLPQRIIQDV